MKWDFFINIEKYLYKTMYMYNYWKRVVNILIIFIINILFNTGQLSIDFQHSAICFTHEIFTWLDSLVAGHLDRRLLELSRLLV